MNTNTATTAELIAKYNELTGKSIKKFSSRAAGEKQVLAAMDKKAHAATGVTVVRVQQVVQEKPVVRSEAKAEKNSVRSEAIRRSWDDYSVKQARSARHHVKVSGKIYRSVKQAFEELGLPLNKHIKFRMELKQHAEMTFRHEGKQVKFSVVQE